MSFYQSIISTGEPFDMGTDDNNRTLMVANYYCRATGPVDKFEEEIMRLLFDAGLATAGTDTFISGNATIPDGDGPFTTIIRTPSFPPLETHDGNKYESLSCQVTVRAKTYRNARTRAIAIWRALDGRRNLIVTAA